MKYLLTSVLAVTLSFLAYAGLAASKGHQSWSEDVFQKINQTYGPAAERRMLEWESNPGFCATDANCAFIQHDQTEDTQC